MEIQWYRIIKTIFFSQSPSKEMCTALICRSFLMKKKQNSKMEVHWQRYSRSSALFLSHAVCLSSVVYARNERCVASVCVYVYWSVFVGALLKRRQTNEAGFDKILFSNCWIHRTVDRLRVLNGSTWRKRIRFLLDFFGLMVWKFEFGDEDILHTRNLNLKREFR